MNPNDPHHPWARLVTAARSASDGRDAAAPYGFATRIAALAFSRERKARSLFERFALRAVGVSCLLALVSVAANYTMLTGGRTTTVAVDDNENGLGDDPVAVVLDLTD